MSLRTPLRARHRGLTRGWRPLVVALLGGSVGLVAGGLVSVATAPAASAAGCSSTDGVTVVVDFGELGGGVRQGCAPSGGDRPASEVLPDAGFTLDYVQRQPSFVCRVAGAPSADPCVNTPPADAYWALYWSDGKSGSWSYASAGVGALEVPDGGYVAFAWQDSLTKSPPGLRPAPRTQAPTPAPQGEAPGGGRGGGAAAPGGATGGSTGGSEVAPSLDPSAVPSAGAGAERRRPGAAEQSGPAAPGASSDAPAGEQPGDAPSTQAGVPAGDQGGDATPGTDDAPSGGVPGWVTLTVLAVLVVAAATASVVRRRRGSTSP